MFSSRTAEAGRAPSVSVICPRISGLMPAHISSSGSSNNTTGEEFRDRRLFCKPPDDGSETRARLASAFDRFVDISRRRTGTRRAWRVTMRSDILVDLDGYQRAHEPRFSPIARRRSRSAISGVAGTTGADFVDFILVSPFVVAEQSAGFLQRAAGAPAGLLPM